MENSLKEEFLRYNIKRLFETRRIKRERKRERLLSIGKSRNLENCRAIGSCVAARGGAKNNCFLTAELIRVGRSGRGKIAGNRGERGQGGRTVPFIVISKLNCNY